jgi:DNA-binding response OmpR family regulator
MRQRLLIVDDEIDVLGIVTEYLEALGYSVLGAMSGKEALALIDGAEGEIAAAVIDWSLPDVSGRDVIRSLRDRQPACPVVVTTGHGADVVSDELAGQHATAVLRKPFTMRSLAVRVEALVAQIE